MTEHALALTVEEITIWVTNTLDSPEPLFFDNQEAAELVGRDAGCLPAEASALQLSDGRILLSRREPITLVSDPSDVIRHRALARLTEVEKRVLGLLDSETAEGSRS